MNKSLDKYSLYITYDGLLDPLGHSQILPYIEGLSLSGHKIVLLSFEKTDRLESSIKKLKSRLKSKNIEWFYYSFKRQKFGYFKRIFWVFYFIKFRLKYKVFALFHTRGITTAIIYFICGSKCSFNSTRNFLFKCQLFSFGGNRICPSQIVNVPDICLKKS